MPDKISNEPDKQDQMTEMVFSWTVPEDIKYAKNVWWHMIAITVVVASVSLAFAFNNPLFGIFLVLFYLVILIYEYREPQIVDFIITPDGIKFGRQFFFYKDFDHFYVVYEEEGIKNLYLEFKNFIRGRLIVSVDGQDAVAIRDYLLNFITEDLEREAEPLSERVRRWLRL